MQTEALLNQRLQFHCLDGQPHQRLFAQDVAYGLSASQKWLPPKYFYDERGSQLYEQICALPEYYPYRAELEILRTHAAEIHAEIGRRVLRHHPAINGRDYSLARAAALENLSESTIMSKPASSSDIK